MRALAHELGIHRATLYRWTGGREDLLGDVIWSLAEELWRDALARAGGRGVVRVMAVVERLMSTLARAEALRRFLEADAQVALRVLTTRGGRVEGRLVASTVALFREEQERGALVLRLEPEVIAYAAVRVVESFLYNDVICALEPDVDHACAVVRILLA
jgi:AcrR family transcriptional regulator